MNPTCCRSCQSSETRPILALGTTPLANSLLRPEQLAQPEPRFPLTVTFCTQCSLVQIEHTVPPEDLFSEYVYLSSFSTTMLKHAEAIANRMVHERHLTPDSRVIEIASNDGYLLQYYRAQGIPVLGIEPARNIAAIAETQRGIPTLTEFFGRECADRLAGEGLLADVVHANNVMAHVPDINGFVAGLARILKPAGVAVIEAPYLKDLIDHIEFDTIYHEHVFYFSVTALQQLFERAGLELFDVERVAIHGGSLRLFVGHPGANPPSGRVKALLDEEDAWGVRSFDFYADFSARVAHFKSDLLALIADIRARGQRIAVYGASAKGSTLLNYCGLDHSQLEFAADRSTVKQGLYTPGSHLLIRPPESLLEEKPDYVLLLAWNFADEILEQQSAYRAAGGKFIVPLPQLAIV